ncbi:MAG: DUF2798 domain-containing protein [bacterium]|nr:DUF2798 domain-containing protein [bacterium]
MNSNSLPRDGKEGAIYGGIICFLTCSVMATMNICINFGAVNRESLFTVLKAFPLVFVIAMVLEGAIIGKIAEKLVKVYSEPTDSLNSYLLFRTLFTVIGMSVCMTLIGGVLGTGFSTEIFKEFVEAWPRNACMALFLELVIVQPIARKAMRTMHAKKDGSVELNDIAVEE